MAIDLAIVVVGVFLGIQASNWNDERRNRQLARDYLGRIGDDLKSDEHELAQREIYWRGAQQAGLRALEFAEKGRTADSAWQTLLDFYSAGQLWVYSPNDATYRELVSAGRIDLVQDIRLRHQLADYYVTKSAQDKVLFQTLPAYRENIRAVVPYELQSYILDRCDMGLSGAYRVVPCPPPNSNANYRATLRSILADKELVGELRTWMTTLRYTRAVGEQNRNNANALAARVERLSR